MTSPKTIKEILTKTYVDSLSENDRSRKKLSIVVNDEDNEFNIFKLTKTDIITVKRISTTNFELSSHKHIDDELDKTTMLKFNQTAQNYPKVSSGNNSYNL